MLSTPDLCDQNPDKVQVLEIFLQDFGKKSAFSGQIVTVKCFEDNSKVKELVGTPGSGKVLVVDGGGSTRRALLGDMLAEKAVSNGWQGIVIYGCARDVEIIETLDLGVKALGAVPLKTDKRDLGDIDVPVRFGGVDFVPGYWLYADKNGVVVSAQALE